jgi:hypothetical protein
VDVACRERAQARAIGDQNDPAAAAKEHGRRSSVGCEDRSVRSVGREREAVAAGHLGRRTDRQDRPVRRRRRVDDDERSGRIDDDVLTRQRLARVELYGRGRQLGDGGLRNRETPHNRPVEDVQPGTAPHRHRPRPCARCEADDG